MPLTHDLWRRVHRHARFADGSRQAVTGWSVAHRSKSSTNRCAEGYRCAGSLASAAYVWRIVEILWAKPPDIDFERSSAPLALVEWLPLALLTALAVWFGLHASFTLGLATDAAQSMVAFPGNG